MLENDEFDINPDTDLDGISLNIIPDDRKCLLEEGDELVFGFNYVLEGKEQMHFTFEIVFNETGVAECEPILPLLVQTLNYINDLIVSFKTLLA